jgi:DHA1 family multidrug resistance protein-like MFS transporter
MQSESWKKNLYLIAISEFFALVGFSLFNPFMPLYMQQLGNLTTRDAAFWSGIAIGGAGVAMFVSSPFWGIIADRRGRKPMLLRAQFGGAVVIALFIIVPNIYVFTFFRMLQGLFTGTITAASALIAVTTPREKLPFSMGVLMGAVFSGFTIGPLAGGFLADSLGFEATFAITSGLLLIGGLIITLFVKENFQRPAAIRSNPLPDLLRLAISPEILPLLMVIAAINLGPQIISPVVSLVISQLSSGDAASSAGMAMALMGVVTVISSLVIGRLHGRFSTKRILIFCCLGTGLLYLPPMWAHTELLMILAIGLTGLLVGGIFTASNSLVGLAVPVTQQGIAYGLSQSANSLGSGVGPFIGGGLAPVIGLRPIFGVTAGVFVLVGCLAIRLIPERAGPVIAVDTAKTPS